MHPVGEAVPDPASRADGRKWDMGCPDGRSQRIFIAAALLGRPTATNPLRGCLDR